MSKNKLARIPSKFVQTREELPALPEAFQRYEYDGWLPERIKRFQLKQYQRTQAERLAVLKQINQIQGECLALARNEANWRHFQQEDRLRQKRLDLEEMELNHHMEDLLYERERKLAERSKNAIATTPRRRNLVDEITNQLENAIQTETGVKEAFAHARKAHPHLETWLNEWEAQVSWDLRERKWS